MTDRWAETAALAEKWLDGATQHELGDILGQSATAVSVRFRKFVARWLPDEKFHYAESRKKVMREALSVYAAAPKGPPSPVLLMAKEGRIAADLLMRAADLLHEACDLLEQMGTAKPTNGHGDLTE